MLKKYLQVITLLFTFTGMTAAQQASPWFSVKEISSKVWLIDDHKAVNIYLVEGSDSTLLIDTGIGIADLLSQVRKLSQKPLIVVNTHGHPDHAGGNYQFEKIYVNASDSAAARRSSTPQSRATAAKNMLRGAQPQVSEKYNGEELHPAFATLVSGYIFKLGGRQLEVIETPGHTPGSICLIDRENKILFSGDNNNTAVWLFLPESLPLKDYMSTLQTLARQISDFKTILPGHGISKKSDFINDQIQCVSAILSGNCVPATYNTFAGRASLCQFGRASVAYDPDKL
jgi:glyoxylase-like metal-dependent hydrolase (beta-lactamase superfamily II)